MAWQRAVADREGRTCGVSELGLQTLSEKVFGIGFQTFITFLAIDWRCRAFLVLYLC